MAKHPNPRVEYSGSSALVQRGLLGYVPDLRRAAIVVGVPQPEVRRQIAIGIAVRYQTLVHLAVQGLYGYEAEARQFALAHGLPVSALERALQKADIVANLDREEEIAQKFGNFYKTWRQKLISEIKRIW